MSNTRMWIAAVPALLALAGGTAAQQQPDRPMDRPMDRPAGQAPAGQDAARPEPKADARTVLRSSDVIGADVRTKDGRDLGDINDLIVDVKRGCVVYGLVTRGATLGIGGEDVAVPWEALMPAPATEQFYALIDEQRLQSAPALESDDLERLNDPSWNRQVHQHFGVEPKGLDQPPERAERPTGEPMGEPMDEPGEPMAQPDRRQAVASAVRHALHKASDLKGAEVENLQGNQLGEIDELVIETDTGRIVYAVVGVGGFLGVGEDFAAVPFPALRLTMEKDDGLGGDEQLVAVLNIDEQRFREAPRFSRDEWPNFEDPEWGGPVHRYYGMDPDWTVLDEADIEGGQIGGVVGQLGDQGAKLFASGQIVTLRGEVTRIDENAQTPGIGSGVQITVRAEDGEESTVHLAPRTFIDEKGLMLRESQPVTVHGARVEAGGREVILASRVEVNGRTVELRSTDGKPLWSDAGQGGRPGEDDPGSGG